MKKQQVNVDGTDVVVYEIEGTGPLTVLFLHGVGSTGKIWTRQMRHLSAELQGAARMLALDLPGFAQSPLPEGVETLSDLVPVVCRVLDELGVERAVWVGNSLGGRIAVETALERPERVQGLGLLCSAGVRLPGVRVVPPGSLPPEEFDRLVFRHPERFAGLQSPESRAAGAASRALYEELAARTEALGARKMDFSARLGEIRVPTEVIWGRHDGVVPLPIGEAFAEGIPGAVLTVLEESAHAPQVEQAQEVNERLERLLRRVQKGVQA